MRLKIIKSLQNRQEKNDEKQIRTKFENQKIKNLD
jgi:hypothetical protein